MSTATRRTFAARYDGGCGGCSAQLHIGDEVFFVGHNELPIGSDCCGDRPDEELTAPGKTDEPAGLSVDDEDPATAIARVMPRGRTAKQTCPKCWQIPANNGSCGCDY